GAVCGTRARGAKHGLCLVWRKKGGDQRRRRDVEWRDSDLDAHDPAAGGHFPDAGIRLMRISEGSPVRLGASWDGRGTNFALFSAHAERVELCFFDNHGRREIERLPLPERTEDVWHGYLHDIAPGQLYGYRVHGPYDPEH